MQAPLQDSTSPGETVPESDPLVKILDFVVPGLKSEQQVAKA